MEQLSLHHLFQVNEIEISYRNTIPYGERLSVISSATAYEVLRALWDVNRMELVEQFKILLLDGRNACLGVSTIATGGRAACLADPRIIFTTALKAGAMGQNQAHNHPSGHLTPSQPDRDLTRKLKDGGRLLDIAVHDHLIITPRTYLSFADEGLMPG